jgi:hypothetical protein
VIAGEEAGVAVLIQGRDVEGDTYLLRTLLLVGLDRSLFFLILFCPVQSEMLQEANTSNFKSKLQSLQVFVGSKLLGLEKLGYVD